MVDNFDFDACVCDYRPRRECVEHPDKFKMAKIIHLNVEPELSGLDLTGTGITNIYLG